VASINNKNLNGLAEIIANKPVWVFFTVTLAIALITSLIIRLANLNIFASVSGIFLYLVYMLCPVLVAATLLAISESREGAISLFRGLLRWEADVQWYILVILLPVAVELLTVIVFLLISNNSLNNYRISLVPLNITLVILISSLGLALGLGYMLPLLMKTYSPFVSSAITAVFLIIYRGTALINDPNAIIMCIGLVALAYFIVWLYDSTRQSLLLLTVFLFVYTYLQNLVTYPIAAFSGSSLPIYIDKIVFIIGIVAVFLVFRKLSWD
jgi:hypothetical protein